MTENAASKATSTSPSVPLAIQEEQVLPDMDPLSATASVAGVLALAVQLVKGVYKVAQVARDYRKELNELGAELAALTGFLMTLKASITPADGSESTSSGTPSSGSSSPSLSSKTSFSDSSYELVDIAKPPRAFLVEQMMNEMIACQRILEDVNRFLSHSFPKRYLNFRKQITWVLKRADIQDLLDKVERHKLNFVLILSAQGT